MIDYKHGKDIEDEDEEAPLDVKHHSRSAVDDGTLGEDSKRDLNANKEKADIKKPLKGYASKKSDASKKEKKKKKRKKKSKKRNEKDEHLEEVNEQDFFEEDFEVKQKAMAKEEKEKAQKITTFRFRISNMRLKLVGKKAGLPDIFMEFEIGGLSKEVTHEAGESKAVTKESKGGEKTTVSVPKKRRETEIHIRSCDRYYTRLMKVQGGSSDEVVVKFAGQEVDGLWTGTYESLRKETLSIRIWHTTPAYQPNRFVGYSELNMAKVAQSQIEREEIIYRWTESQAVRAEAFAILNFKFELEEIFDFQIKLSKWKVELGDEEDDNLDSNSCGFSGFPANPPLVLGFEMDNTSKVCGSLAKILQLHSCHYHCLAYKELRCCDPLPCPGGCCRVLCNWRCPWLTTNTHCVTTAKDANRSVYTSVPEYEDASKRFYESSPPQTLIYHGTRSNLEDESIRIYFWKGYCCLNGICCKPVFGCCGLFPNACDNLANRCWSYPCCNCIHGPSIGILGGEKDTLQGKLDYGYLILYETELSKYSFTICGRIFDGCCNKKNRIQAESIKGVIATLNEPRYRQLGNVGRPSGGNRWFRFEKNTLYLAVCVVRAKGLQSLQEYKETLNPSASVDWAQIRREIDMKEDNPEPFWNETVFFKVDVKDSALKKPNLSAKDVKKWLSSKILINVWDSAGFSKAPLGYCEIEFSTVFYNRKPKLVESTFGKSGLVSRYVYQTKQKLESPLTSEDDDRGTASANDKHVELMIYFEMGNGKRVGPAKKPRNGELIAEETIVAQKGKKLIRDPKIDDNNLRQARDFWLQALDSVPEFEKRTFAFCGIDEFSRNTYYLPTFLSVMVPPAEIKSESMLLYYVTSIETVLRKSGENYMQAKKRQEELNKIAPGLRIWSDPWYFLDKRRGDHRDHAVLLCNFLLGLKKKAYVCVGRAQTPTGEQEHVWVMTLEDPDHRDGEFPRTVRFWECAVGKTYVRMNRRLRQSSQDNKLKLDDDMDDGMFIEQNLAFQEDFDGDDEDGGDAYSTAYSQKMSRISQMRERKRFQYQLRQDLKSRLVNDDDEQKRWKAHQERTFDNEGQVPTPYTMIDVVFDNENVYANLQQPHPENISYDFEDPLGWRSFRGREQTKNMRRLDDGEKYFWQAGQNNVRQFYPDKTMIGTKAQEQVVYIKEAELIKIIEGAIQGYREFRSEGTKFFRKFPFQEQLQGLEDTAIIYMKKRLEEECNHGRRDKCLVSKEIRKFQTEITPEQEEVGASGDVGGYKDTGAVREVWMKDIKESLPRNQKYEEMLFYFRHADSSRISDTVIDRISRFLHIASSQNPRFAVGAKIHRLPGYISPVRVLVAIIYNKK